MVSKYAFRLQSNHSKLISQVLLYYIKNKTSDNRYTCMFLLTPNIATRAVKLNCIDIF